MKFQRNAQVDKAAQSKHFLGRGVLQRKCSCGKHARSGGGCAECDKKKNDLQRKLTIGSSNDVLEQEADRVAEQVLAGWPQSAASHGPLRIQRYTGQEKMDFDSPPASVQRVLSGSGRPLDTVLQQDMQARFGHDFSHVRVHSGSAAESSARDVNANAYTVGHKIVFGAGMYAPRTRAGSRLLAHELTHVVQQGGGSPKRGVCNTGQAVKGFIQRVSPPKPTSENVWGLRVTRSMCGCRPGIRDGIAWANTAAATYAACDVPANATGTDVEACFDLAHPTAVVVATTDSSGTVTLPPPSADPCEQINNKATFVHEEMHRRHTNDIARGQGSAFFREWRRLAGDPNRLDTLRASFPTEVAAFETQWNDGHDWAQDEVNSYTWERRFLSNALSALNRIC